MWQDILVGTLGQWVVKPALGLLLAVTVVPLLGLPHAVGTGLILVSPPVQPILTWTAALHFFGSSAWVATLCLQVCCIAYTPH